MGGQQGVPLKVVMGTPRLPEPDRPEEDEVEASRRRRFQKAMSLKDSIGLTDDERYQLAQWIPGVDKDFGGSWKELNPKQLHDLITMMEGFVLITHMINERRTT
jgi:hypothetical protein